MGGGTRVVRGKVSEGKGKVKGFSWVQAQVKGFEEKKNGNDVGKLTFGRCLLNVRDPQNC